MIFTLSFWRKHGDHPKVVKFKKRRWGEMYGVECVFCGFISNSKTHGSYGKQGRRICPNTWIVDYPDGTGLVWYDFDMRHLPYLLRDINRKVHSDITELNKADMEVVEWNLST